MAIRTIYELLKLDNPEEYDFKNESDTAIVDLIDHINRHSKNDSHKDFNMKAIQYLKKIQEYGDNAENLITKFMDYVEYGKCGQTDDWNNAEKPYWLAFDCDSSNGLCNLTNRIYYMLWAWEWDYIKYKEKRRAIPESLRDKFPKWDEINSDTMNSFKTTYNAAIIIEAVKQNIITPEDVTNLRSVKDFHYKANDLAKNSEITCKARDNPYLQKFAGLTHSIGNFTLIPYKLRGEPFNASRGASVCDYWDLSLKLLKEDFSGETFKSYINTFFLNDYVDENYDIKPLMARHEKFLRREKLLPLEPPESEIDFLPKSEKELNEYLKNVICKIKLRGIRIVDELRKSDKFSVDLYKAW